MKSKLTLLLVVALLAAAAQGATIPLVNGGFEQPATGKITAGFDVAGVTDVPGWHSGAMTDSGIESINHAPAGYEGQWWAYVKGPVWGGQSDGPVWQLTDYVIAAGENYRVTCLAASDYVTGATGQIDVSLYYDNAGTRVIMDTVTVTGLTNNGPWVSGSLIISADDYSASIGKKIGVQFQNTFDGWVGIDDIQLEQAYFDFVTSHDPANGETKVAVDLSDRTIADNFSWLAPGDPNIAEIKGYDIYLDPNDVKVTNRQANCLIKASTAAGVTQYNPSSVFDFGTTYSWVVDTRYTRDDDPNLGTPNERIYVGSPSAVWSFQTVTASPVINTYDSVITTTTLLPAALSAVVTDGDGNLNTAAFTLLTDDVEFPAGATASLQNLNVSNLYAPSVQLVTDTAGTYKVKLTVTDSAANSTEAIAEVVVYAAANACAAAQAAPSWAGFNPMDFDTDCDVDLTDFAAFAAQWLDDTNLAAQEGYVANPSVTYTPFDTLVNGNFETGDFTGMWNSDGAAITAVSPLNGTYSAEWTVAGGDGITASTPIHASTSYTVTAKILGGSTNPTDEFFVRYAGGDAVAIQTPTWTPNATVAQTATIVLTTAAGDEGRTVEFVIYGHTEGIYYKVDNLQITAP